MSNPLRGFIAFMLLSAAFALPVRAQQQEQLSAAVSDQADLNHAATKSEAAPAASQNDSPYRLKRGDNEFGFWSATSFGATTVFGGLTDEEASDRRLFILAFRYGRTLAANESVALQYTLDAIPLAIASGNIVESIPIATTTGPVTIFRRKKTYGAGLTPLGLQLDFANGSRVHPFIHVNGGFLAFSDSVPLPDAGGFAYIGEAGAGLRIFTAEQRALSLGFRFHHISNGNRAGANRGLNEFMVSVGFSFFR